MDDTYCCLLLGGAGYIGSHTCVELLKEGYTVVVVDNFVNSREESLKRVKEIVGEDKAQNLYYYDVDLKVCQLRIVRFVSQPASREKDKLREVFDVFSIDSVIHFAGLKAVGESVTIPLLYYDNNIYGTLTLLDVSSPPSLSFSFI